MMMRAHFTFELFMVVRVVASLLVIFTARPVSFRRPKIVLLLALL